MPESRRNEVLSFVKSGLNDLSVSRTSLTWGIKVPGEEKHVIYVWLDALFNYYSAIDNDADKKFWPCDLHVIGKDILRFHAVYWPAFLMAAELELPKCIFAHAWWTNNTEKISKSLGNVIDPIQLVEEFGLDYVRYFLAREMPYGNDKDYSREIFINRINSDLCNNIGNLVQRVLSFVNKYCGGKIPTPNLDANDKQLLTVAYAALNEVRGFVENAQIGLAVDSIIKVSSRANEYIDTQAPWSLRKTDTKRMETVLYTLMEVIRVIGILLQPFIPNAAEKILDMLAVEGYNFICLNADTALQPGVSLPAPNIVFPKIEG
jgi:methionyl-tRNA synthetase